MFKVKVNDENREVKSLPELQQMLKDGLVQPDTAIHDSTDNTWKTVAVVLRPPDARPQAPSPSQAAAPTPAPPKSTIVQLQQSKADTGRGSGGNVLAALCSFFIPGLGQLLQGRIFTALEHFVLAVILWVFMLGWLVHIWSVVSAATYKPTPGFFEEMAKEFRFKTCPACRQDIDKKASICPYCQTKQEQA